MAQMVERVLGKDEVPGSNPGISSKGKGCRSDNSFFILPKLIPSFLVGRVLIIFQSTRPLIRSIFRP